MRCNVNLQAVAKALKLVERQQGRSSDDVQNQGRVDYVKVADWGSGRPDELGDLKLAAPPQELTSQMPFYEQLARHLEVLQSEGLLNVARPEGAAPLPPFQRWAFAEAHYRQHLADLLSVHAALESLSARILEQLEASAAQGGHESKAMAEAFALLVGPATGLARAECIAKDLAALGDGGGSTAPGPNAAQYARYLKDLAERCKTGFETEAELCEVAARFLSHGYAIMLTFLTSGTRIGASAAEKLDLFQKDALHTFRTYPEGIKDPLVAFRQGVDAAGQALTEEQREGVMAELPDAFRRSSLLLEALAREK